MTIGNAAPTRKQRFESALKLAGMTSDEWRHEVHRVSKHHLVQCWKGEKKGGRKMGPELEAAIDRFIDEVFMTHVITPYLRTHK